MCDGLLFGDYGNDGKRRNRSNETCMAGLLTTMFATVLNTTFCMAIQVTTRLMVKAAMTILLLDLQLPDGDGLTFLSTLRDQHIRTPVIILTARDKVSDRIDGLNRGADDYVTKPFDLDEVKARIHTVCSRSADQMTQTTVVRDLSIRFDDHSVTRAGAPVRLTAKEWSVLEVLLRRKSKIVPKESLEVAVYAFGDEVESNAIEAHISRLRAKLGKDLIVTHRGIGYMLHP